MSDPPSDGARPWPRTTAVAHRAAPYLPGLALGLAQCIVFAWADGYDYPFWATDDQGAFQSIGYNLANARQILLDGFQPLIYSPLRPAWLIVCEALRITLYAVFVFGSVVAWRAGLRRLVLVPLSLTAYLLAVHAPLCGRVCEPRHLLPALPFMVMVLAALVPPRPEPDEGGEP